MYRNKVIYLPKWATILYAGLALILIPWIFNLAQNLPSRHLVRHWDAMWVGFDVILLLTMAITIWFVIRKRVWVILSASALATLFVVDSWFDIMSSRPGMEHNQAIFFGVLEILLAIVTFRLVYLVISRSSQQKEFTITTKK